MSPLQTLSTLPPGFGGKPRAADLHLTPDGRFLYACERTSIIEKAMGSIVKSGTAPIEDVGWELFHLMLDVASGRKKTWAEHWKLHNALVLFNPAPVT